MGRNDDTTQPDGIDRDDWEAETTARLSRKEERSLGPWWGGGLAALAEGGGTPS